MINKQGYFISLEGGEGVGKSTQIRLLGADLKEKGFDIIETREPGGCPGGNAIRHLLLEGDIHRWTNATEALLFAAARSEHVTRVIRPALDKGQWVLCDRYIDSSLAYQGDASGIGEDNIRKLHYIGSQGLMPHRTLLLVLPNGEGVERAKIRDGNQGNRFEKRDLDYHKKVNEAFHKLALENPERFRIIDASGTAEMVHKRIMHSIDDLLS
ncbi:thymidylate kinase [Zymomonas mobilis subsp. pomaceae ATCC 29192]|uniref:Thymidylate kinase n=1 Tax=Zymomonas mobilis subsp. pomaceae (strain ATCC 29192 / DSM 22645 / JCM 10191 / CCUG 17912 / NBRC 13757 / NCIMB 11200 / NRRL B-4491 / Barker I) TaxID=579138 RepID=F8EU22_ZYMMT|nr:thymidylate kinase [Zymomonas mobilis subsp. pomaceae ATCC 29192]